MIEVDAFLAFVGGASEQTQGQCGEWFADGEEPAFQAECGEAECILLVVLAAVSCCAELDVGYLVAVVQVGQAQFGCVVMSYTLMVPSNWWVSHCSSALG